MQIKNYWLLLFAFAILILARIFLFPKQEIPFSNKQRFVSNAPNVTEILFALSQKEKIVGVTRFCVFPKEAEKIEKIGDLFNPDIEKIVSLKPTKFFSLKVSNPELKKALELSETELIEIPNETIDEIFEGLKIIGKSVGEEQKADSLEKSIRFSLQTLSQKYKIGDSLRVGIVVGRSAGSLEEIFVAGKKTFYTELLELLGAKNAFAKLPNRYPSVTLEVLIEINPDVLIEISTENELSETQKEQILALWKQIKGLSAVENGNFKFLNGDFAAVPSLRIGKTLEELGKTLNLKDFVQP